MRREEIELLAPAGSYEGFEAAIGAGADAVYVGEPPFAPRHYAKNYEEKNIFLPINNQHINARKI